MDVFFICLASCTTCGTGSEGCVTYKYQLKIWFDTKFFLKVSNELAHSALVCATPLLCI